MQYESKEFSCRRPSVQIPDWQLYVAASAEGSPHEHLVGLVANSALDIQYGWRLGNNKSVNFDTKVLLPQFDLVQYPQYDETMDINDRMLLDCTRRSSSMKYDRRECEECNPN